MRFFSVKLPSFVGLLLVVLALPAYSTQLPNFSDIVKQNAPAVVRIEIEQKPKMQRDYRSPPHNYQGMPDSLRRFFEDRGTPPAQGRQSLGSGFIISSDGYIVTNNHVVAGADDIIVRMSDRREFVAMVVGTDERSDLALLKIDAEGLPTLKLSESDELEVGEWVLAMGSPFGLDYSVSAGIVSAKGRSLPTEKNENYVPFVQTDVAINPGNSGGPLFNLKGDVVAVNSQIYTRSGGSIGLSFAIPVNVVRNVIEQLKTAGTVTRGWLGVTIQDVDKALAESFGLDNPRGALISGVQDDGPAYNGGLLAGDIIISFNGEPIYASSDLPHVVGLAAPGSEAKVQIVRNRKPEIVTVEVGGLGEEMSPAKLSAIDSESRGGKFGLLVDELNEQKRESVGISGGVIVLKVARDGAGDQAGVKSGDVITLIDTTPVDSIATYRRVVSGLRGGSSVPMRIIRRGRPIFIGIKVNK
jgi:serine protease Do